MTYVDYYMHLLDRSMNVASTNNTPKQFPDIWEKLLKIF